MKIAGATILSAMAFSGMVSAAPAKRDNLNCHPMDAGGKDKCSLTEMWTRWTK